MHQHTGALIIFILPYFMCIETWIPVTCHVHWYRSSSPQQRCNSLVSIVSSLTWTPAAVHRSNILMNNGEMSDAGIRKYTIQSIWIAADNGEEYFLGSGGRWCLVSVQ